MSDSRWRRLAWISYGNMFLQDKIRIYDWYQHYLLRDVCFQFREFESGNLIAPGIFEWLQYIKGAGAVRLSLALLDDLPDTEGQVTSWDRQTVIVHYADHTQFWAMGTERFVDGCPAVGQSLGPRKWLYRSYQADVDCYWLIRSEPRGGAELPSIDWKSVIKEVQPKLSRHRKLLGVADSRERGYAPFYARTPTKAHGALPTLPNDPSLPWPHRIFNMFAAAESSYHNLSHPQNDTSIFHRGDEATALEFSNYRAFLDSETERIQCLAGSETRWIAEGKSEIPSI